MATSLKVGDISFIKHDFDKFVSIFLYFLGKDKGKQLVHMQISQELYLKNGFRANMLIENNIIGFEQIFIDITKKTTLVASYRICILISIKQRL